MVNSFKAGGSMSMTRFQGIGIVRLCPAWGYPVNWRSVVHWVMFDHFLTKFSRATLFNGDGQLYLQGIAWRATHSVAILLLPPLRQSDKTRFVVSSS